jgi:ribonuclease HI
MGVVAFCPNTSKTELHYLGPEEKQNVYTAEATVFELAANIAQTSPPTFTMCVIYTDSQATIKGISKPNKQSGQGVLITAINKIELLAKTSNMRTEIKWIPGHKDIIGNEIADKATK